jgi:hypothetical protein
VSRYLILIILNAPLVAAGLVTSLVAYKMKRISRRKFLFQTLIWLIIYGGIVAAKFIYEFLFSNNLTQTEPLSLFDVIQITGIIFVLFMANRSRLKVENLERRVQDLHQELSIRLSEDAGKKNKK